MEIYDLYQEEDNNCSYCDAPTDNEDLCDNCLRESYHE